jgi:hypothetical protein
MFMLSGLSCLILWSIYAYSRHQGPVAVVPGRLALFFLVAAYVASDLTEISD